MFPSFFFLEVRSSAHVGRARFQHALRKKTTTAALALLLLCGCAGPSLEQARALPPNATPARFLLTFDDGPSTWQPYNPTRAILDTLARNPVQPGIKAVFFLQTRDPRAGASEAGRALMRREHAEGHVLAVHSGSPRGHIDHMLLPDPELDRTLADAQSDIAAITGRAPDLVRPPFWNYDARTLAAYRRRGLHMLLTDVSANDGVIYFWNISLRRRSHIRTALAQVREQIAAGAAAGGRRRDPAGGHLSRHQHLHRAPHGGVPAHPDRGGGERRPGARAEAVLRRRRVDRARRAGARCGLGSGAGGRPEVVEVEPVVGRLAAVVLEAGDVALDPGTD